MTQTQRSRTLSHLAALESESIHIIREVVAEMQRPCLLFSGGKDSAVLLHLAAAAFAPLSWLNGLSALPTPGDLVEDVSLVGPDGGREGLAGAVDGDRG